MDSEENALARVQVTVLSSADPPATDLFAARQAVQTNNTTQQVFIQARKEGWSAEKLAEEVAGRFSEQFDKPVEEVRDVARYLADEYLQVGDGLLLISRETGRAIAKVVDEHLWTPAPVAREDGRMVKSLPRLRPELEAFLIMQEHENEREKKLLAEVQQRYADNPLVRIDDPMFRPITRMGRKGIVADIRETLPRILHDHVRGAAADFLKHVPIVSEKPAEPGLSNVYGVLEGLHQAPIADLKAVNLHHDRVGAALPVFGAKLVRSLAVQFASVATQVAHQTIEPGPELNEADLPDDAFWVASPDAAPVIRKARPFANVLVVEGVRHPIGILPNAAWVVLDESTYHCVSREVHDRWEILCKVDFTLWFDPVRVAVLPYEAPVTAVAELLH